MSGLRLSDLNKETTYLLTAQYAMAAANFVGCQPATTAATSVGEGCAINGTAVAAIVFIGLLDEFQWGGCK